MSTYDLTSTIPTKIKEGDILNCPYSGAAKSIVLPKGKYKLECWGAEGGGYSNSSDGGLGGYSIGIVTLKQDTIVYLYSGGKGDYNTATGSFTDGGFNGGGKAGYRYGGSGGGGSDIRIGTDSLYARVLVAGGGGGGWGYSSYNGGYGGGNTGGIGTGYSTSYVPSAGTQTSGGSGNGYSSSYMGSNGSFGVGGNASTYSSSYNRSSGGGGGWYGGGGSGFRSSSSYYNRGGGGAGGGSGYIYTSSTASDYPSGCLLNETYYLSDASTIAGNTAFTAPDGTSETGHSGNGYVKITAIEVQTVTFRTKKSYAEDLNIETSGTQYVNTNIKPTNNTRIVLDVDVLPTNTSGSVQIAACSDGTNYFVIRLSADFTKFQVRRGSEALFDVACKGNVFGRHIFDINKGVISVDGIVTNDTDKTFSIDYPIYLFTQNNKGNTTGAAKVKFYSCKIYENGTVVSYIVPKRNSVGDIYFFDKPTGTNLNAQGYTSGTFINNYIAVHSEIVTSNEGYVKVAGAWRTVIAQYVKVNGVWKLGV